MSLETAPHRIPTQSATAPNREAMKSVMGGYVLTCCAGPGPFGYKHSCANILGGAPSIVDRAALTALRESGHRLSEFPFDINGSDERQFSSPAWRIPMGSICKDKYYEFIEYHTSLDNLDFVRPEHLLKSHRIYVRAIDIIEMNSRFESMLPHCEPMLSKRDLFPTIGGAISQKAVLSDHHHRDFEYSLSEEENIRGREIDTLLWTMFLGDGKHDILSVAEKTGVPFRAVRRAADKLVEHGLLSYTA